MSKVRFQPEIIKMLFSNLRTIELENLIAILSNILVARKKSPKKESEKELLLQINQCVLPSEQLARFLFLREKRQAKELPNKEKEELFDLLKNEQQLQLRRIQLLKKLADLRKVSAPKLMNQLEITAPASV